MRSLLHRKARPAVGDSTILTKAMDWYGKLSWRFLQVFITAFILYFLGSAIWFLLWKLPKDQVLFLQGTGLKPNELFVLENEFRRTIVQTIGGIALLIGLYFTWKTVRVSREGQITDRFTKAIQQLGDPKLEVRLGGIFALERIANESEKDRDNISEILSAYVRENAGWKGRKKYEQQLRPSTDVQAILTVLGRRKKISSLTHFFRYALNGEVHMFVLNLPETDLRGANLYSAQLDNANLNGANLEGASLLDATLEKSFLQKTNLSGSKLLGTEMEWVDLLEANLEGADLTFAYLGNARLTKANLRDAKFHNTYVGGAVFDEANLQGVDLKFTTGLTWEQLKKANIDEETKLPAKVDESRQLELKGRHKILER